MAIIFPVFTEWVSTREKAMKRMLTWALFASIFFHFTLANPATALCRFAMNIWLSMIKVDGSL